MRPFIFIMLVLHGSIHLMGFLKAFRLTKMDMLQYDVSRLWGIIWLITTILFVLAGNMYLAKNEAWLYTGIPAVLLSQILVIKTWKDAKWGTLPNVIMVLPILISIFNFLPSGYPALFEKHVRNELREINARVITDADLAGLPEPVMKYLYYSGAVGKPQVINLRATLKGKIRLGKDKGWLEYTAKQYSFFDDPARLYYIQSEMYGVPFSGLHTFIGKNARMLIGIPPLVQFADARGEIMNRSETVTMFNDMCVMAPSTLISKNIQWQTIDMYTVKATFTNKGYTISAFLHFNDNGQLVRFVSDDRYQSADGDTYKNYRWETYTDISGYKNFDGWILSTSGKAVWKEPKGDFPYATVEDMQIEYNCKEFK